MMRSVDDLLMCARHRATVLAGDTVMDLTVEVELRRARWKFSEAGGIRR